MVSSRIGVARLDGLRGAMWIAASAGFLALACGGPLAPVSVPPANTPSVPAPPPPSPLHEALSRHAQAQDPLSVLPADIRTTLEEHASRLSPEQRTALTTPGNPAISVRPLLHFALGGRELEALRALVASTVASDELVQLRLEERRFDDLGEVSNALLRVAAQHVLKVRAPATKPGVKPDAAALEDIALCATALRDAELERLALEQLQALEALPERTAALALSAAEAGDVERAQALRAQLQSAERQYSWLDEAIAAAQVVSGPAAAPVAKARALLRLAREQEALAVLAAAPELSGRLDYETTWVLAKLGGTTCPFVLRPNAVLCRAGFVKASADGVFARLDESYQQGAGRDVEAVEAFLGFRYVLPMMYRVGPEGTSATAESYLGYLSKLQEVAASSTAVSPDFAGIALFAFALESALSATIEQTDSPRAAIAPARREQLNERASALEGELASRAWGQAGVLGALSLLAQDQSTSAHLSSLLPALLPEMERPFAALSLWSALADNRPEELATVRPILARVAKSPLAGPERSHWLVLWAEAEAHLFPTEKNRSNLVKIAERLADADMPLGARLRAVLNLAGVRARSGDLPGAVEVLDELVVGTPRAAVQSQDEQELLIAATGYLLILRGLIATGEERQDYASKVEALLREVNGSNAAPPTLQLWMALWRQELGVLGLKEACAGRKACERRAERARRIDRKMLDEALGERTAQLLANGVVPIGGVQLEFSFEGDGRLRPVIAVSPSFPLLHVPAL